MNLRTVNKQIAAFLAGSMLTDIGLPRLPRVKPNHGSPSGAASNKRAAAKRRNVAARKGKR